MKYLVHIGGKPVSKTISDLDVAKAHGLAEAGSSQEVIRIDCYPDDPRAGMWTETYDQELGGWVSSSSPE